MPRQDASLGPNPAAPDALSMYLASGFGELNEGPGERYVRRTIDDAVPPQAGSNAKRLLRFAHMPDLQISDDESPTRLGTFDSATGTDAALRPQDGYLCAMVNAAVRTINGLHEQDPMSFVLLGGDNADSAQANEISWVLDILGGSERAECDSGSDDEIMAGAGNDGKDPFRADGLRMPWKWVTGNHDVLVQGTFPITDTRREVALGTTATGGTRNYANGAKGALLRNGSTIPADPKRALLDRKALMARIAEHGDGHGLGAAQKASGKAIYTFDVEGSPLRFLVLDSATEAGGAEGIIHQADVDSAIRPALDLAKAESKWVVLASHHSIENLTAEGGPLGVPQADAVLPDAWRAFLGAYPNILLSMVGHSHQHRVRAIPSGGGHAFWELMTSAIADYPHQFRIVELFDQDNGWLMIRATAVDLDLRADPIASEGRRAGIVDFTSGWGPVDGLGLENDRNVELWLRKP
jgi:3',5'-cyclic AMP phosphodiesterase CpdA